MPGLFNETGEYAVQAVLLLASSHGAGPVPLHALADRLGAPPHLFGKIMRMLRRKGFVVFRMGQSGGYLLGRPAEQITLDEVAQSVQGSFSLAGCIIGLPECGEARCCPLCPRWTQSRWAINGFLKRQNIAELSAGLPASVALDGRVGVDGNQPHFPLDMTGEIFVYLGQESLKLVSLFPIPTRMIPRDHRA